MNKRQTAQANAILGAKEFSATLLDDFTHTPPTKVDVKFASARALLTTSVADLGGKQSIQSGGAYGEESARQKDLREALDDLIGDINETASAIADETADPALMSRFRMPVGNGDTGLAATGLGMVKAIREFALNDEFESHGYSADTATELEDLVLELKNSEGDQGSTLGTQTGATAAIPGVLRSGKTGIKILSSIFNRVYKGNIEVLTAWETASHVERRRSPKPATPAPAIP